MLTITIPNNNLKERKYIIDIIFNEFLDIEFQYKIGVSNYEITLENNNKLIYEDHFFSKYVSELDYLKLENIPNKVEYVKNDFIIEKDIPIIFGNKILKIKNSKSIFCGIDIFASIFFMIRRWEEYVNLNRDDHNRFPATESVAYKNGFLDRAVVNEYVEMLWNMLLHLGCVQNRSNKNCQVCLTHDIDKLYFWKNWQQVARVTIGDILKRKSFKLATERITEYSLIKRNKINDSFDTFDWLMDKSEVIGVKSRFYFMSGGVTEYDNWYKIDEPKCLELVNKINKRGHIIGIHHSYNAYNNSKQFKKEKDLLEQTLEQEITEGRGHYLRFEVPETWQIMEDANMEIDSTCGYADRIGFRCGTGEEFSVFNILTREKLKLKERPVILMDFSLFGYQKFDWSEIKNIVRKLIKNKNAITILWHNSQIEHMNIYEQLIDYLYDEELIRK